MPHLASSLLATNWGSPPGVTTQDQNTNFLWALSYYLAIPIGLIVIGLTVWCVVRYRRRPANAARRPSQFQYHIPLEAVYTIIPLLIVATIFGFVYGAENRIDHVSKNPAVEVRVEGFQWGWRFIYLRVNGRTLSKAQQFQNVGSVANLPNINDTRDLPTLTLPANQTVQLDLVSDDVVHEMYIPAALFDRTLTPGVHNTVDFNFRKPAHYIGQCTQFCGTYHAFMRFNLVIMPRSQFRTWAANQKPGSITYPGKAYRSGIPGNNFGVGD